MPSHLVDISPPNVGGRWRLQGEKGLTSPKVKKSSFVRMNIFVLLAKDMAIINTKYGIFQDVLTHIRVWLGLFIGIIHFLLDILAFISFHLRMKYGFNS